MDALDIENKMYKTQISQHEESIASYQEEIKRLEAVNIDLKTRVTVAETETAKVCIENQKLLQVSYFVSNYKICTAMGVK